MSCPRSVISSIPARESGVYRRHDDKRSLWAAVNKISNLKYLIIETAFCNKERELAVISKHLCPSLLAEELANSNVARRSISRI